MANITSRGKGTWRITVSKTVNGKRNRITETFKGTKRKAEERAAQIESDISRNIIDANTTSTTVSEFAQTWVDKHVRENLAVSTQKSYISALNQRILPELGMLKLSDLKPSHVIDFYSKLKDAPRLDRKKGKLSARSAFIVHQVLSAMLSDAVHWQYIFSNPVSRVEPPKYQKKEAKYFDEPDIVELMKAFNTLDDDQHKWKAICSTALFMGMRSGEILGLDWSDIDFAESKLSITKISQYISGVGIITKPPKTASSVRNISIPPTLLSMLKKQKHHQNTLRLSCGSKWGGSNRVFTSPVGNPMHPTSPSKWWHKFVREHGLKEIPFHGLRHTSATMLFHAGANGEDVRKRLGHSDATVFFKIYSHAIESADKKNADLLEAKLMQK